MEYEIYFNRIGRISIEASSSTTAQNIFNEMPLTTLDKYLSMGDDVCEVVQVLPDDGDNDDYMTNFEHGWQQTNSEISHVIDCDSAADFRERCTCGAWEATQK